MNNFDSLQQLALVSWLMSGDVFAVLKRYPVTRNSPYSLRIHLVEADRVSTPDTMGGLTGWPGITDGRNDQTGNQIFDGVEVDGNGMVVAYHIRNTYPWQLTFAEPTVWARKWGFMHCGICARYARDTIPYLVERQAAWVRLCDDPCGKKALCL